jgi:DNA-directed RNA polymerase subunit F
MATEIISETPISSYQLKEELEKIKKRDKELNFRAAKTEEHLTEVDTPKNLDTQYDKISKLNIARLKEQHIRKILDVMPKTVNELKIVMQGYTINVTNDNMNKIIDIINK